MTLFDSINCICCGTEIKTLYENNPQIRMWEGGVVEKISVGYGSINDGDEFYIAICDNCIDDNYKNGRIIYNCTHFGSSKFSDKELKKFEENRRRESNLNKLI
jgi:hypothetical protein